MNDGYGAQQAICPRCGSPAEVRTVKELFDMLDAMRGNAARQAGQGPSPSARGWEADPQSIGQGSRNPGPDPDYYNPDNQIANLVFGLAARAVGKRMLGGYNKRVAPALQAQQQQTQNDQAAIVERYPDLRGCLRDFVLFLPGGASAVPIAELRMPPTLADADALVARLRAS